MPVSTYIPADTLRTEFSTALSTMYRSEVPLYGDLVELVGEVNRDVLATEGSHPGSWQSADRLNVERHGAIRLGTPQELHTIARLFGVLGMFPVGYYDLSTSGVPVHATAFRPLDPASLAVNPFRVFTSLLRPELIPDTALREECMAILSKRNIFHHSLPHLLDKAERQGGLERSDAAELVKCSLETFRWHEQSLVSKATYSRMRACHPLLADIAGFKGPHINHLTPRVLDIDAAQAGMEARGIPPKQIIEGPPRRLCPILLRQTSFKALTEPIEFLEADAEEEDVGSAGLAASAPRRGSGSSERGSHRARFGEIESRGAALTRKGHDLYLSLMARVPPPTLSESNDTHQDLLSEVFTHPASGFPDDWSTLRRERLAYFRYSLSPLHMPIPPFSPNFVPQPLERLVEEGVVRVEPIVYEDFLPASAAGIFQSNLGEEARGPGKGGEGGEEGGEARRRFEQALGRKVEEYWDLYERAQMESLVNVQRATGCIL